MTFVAPPFPAELFDALLALNNAHASELSFKTPAEFTTLINASHAALAERAGLALLVAFSNDSSYDNPNFHWLKQRYDRFIYIDRVVVSSTARGRGLARKLYAELEERARLENRERLVCEINVDPPNSVSDRVHQAFGFVPVGSQELANIGKTVRYWAKVV